MPGLSGLSGISGLPGIFDGQRAFTFDPALATFTAAMAKRAGGVFAGAPLVQGLWAAPVPGPTDSLSASAGSLIATNWRSIIDTSQGTISLWVTPEWDGNDGKQHWLVGTPDSKLKIVSASSGYLQFTCYNGLTCQVSNATWVAGTRYHVVARWDKRTLDGTNHACVSVNDSHTYSGTIPTAFDPTTGLNVGSILSTYYPANALIEGLTIYRRPLYDGTYGVDVGNGDEINLIYAAGAGKDPCLITGSWDVVFCLPTNATPGALATGTGEAWSHPHASALLTDSWCQTTYGSSAWTTKGTPSPGPADIAAAANKVFAWGYEFEAGADADGIEQSLTGLTAGSNYVIRVIAHEDDGADIRVRVTDDTNSADIVTFLFGASSTVNAPGVALFSWELPTVARNGVAANCTAMTIAIEGTAAGQVVDVHQVELQTNLVDNPSLETGAVADPWIPDGWTNGALDAGDSEKETTIVHSGGASMQINATAVDLEGIYNDAFGIAAGAFMCWGGWFYGDGSVGWRYKINSSAQAALQASGGNYVDTTIAANWVHTTMIVRYITATTRILLDALSGASDVRYADDIYAIPLTAVSLTCTPASAANSAESGGIRVDGRDRLTLALASIGATAGTARWSCRPRHAAANAVKFGNAPAYIASLYGAADNYIRVYWSAANTITLAFNDGGGAHTGTWDATGAIVADTEYEFTVRWTPAQMTLAVDGVTKITIAQPVSFATVPATFYAGSLSDGSGQGDAVFV